MIDKILKFLAQHDYLLSFMWMAISYLFGFFSKKLHRVLRSWRLNRMFSMPNLPTCISIPARFGEIVHSENKTSPQEQFITYEEALILVELNKFVEAFRGNRKQLNYKIDFEPLDSRHNNIVVGGFLSNVHTRRIMQDHCRNIKFCCSSNTFSLNKDIQNFLVRHDPHFPTQRWISVNNKRLFTYDRYSEGYIVLAKLTGNKDFCNKDHGTIHICFGNNAQTTLQAVKCFNDFRRELYRRLRKRRKHYFIVIKCDLNGHPDFSQFYDLSDSIFH